MAETCVISAAFEHRLQERAVAVACDVAAEQLRLRKTPPGLSSASSMATSIQGT
jgi:hypothetical protein